MERGRDRWLEARLAWEQLANWHQDGSPTTDEHSDGGDGALTALADIGLLRRLLEQAELDAVRTARRHGKSWTEIAVRLGVTRQSAWERWRDLDEAPAPQPSEGPSQPGTTTTATATTAAAAGGADATAEPAGRVSRLPGGGPAEVVERAARQLRRWSSVVVPDVIGMSWDAARQRLADKGLVAVGPDLGGPVPESLGQPDSVVTDQSPEAGARATAGSLVTLWVSRGGGSAGVREPRRPKPAPTSARQMRYEPSDEAVS